MKSKRTLTKTPKKRVLSFRVEETEWALLQKASRQAGADISTLLRQSLKDTLGLTPKA